MPSAFHQQIASSLATARAVAGVRVLYHKGGVGSDFSPVRDAAGGGPLMATPGRSDFEVASSEGFLTDLQMRDWEMAAADLATHAGAFLPAQGDVIEERRAGAASRFFEVQSPAGRQPEFTHMDPARTWLRIHTKFIREAVAT